MSDRHDERGLNLARLLAMELWGAPIPSELAGKYEDAYQNWIGKRIDGYLNRQYPDQYSVQIEPQPESGKIVPVKAFGTSFWPDVSIQRKEGDPLLAVEVKCLKRRDLPSQLSRGLGQALMYLQIYQQSLLVLAPLEELSMAPPPFFANISSHDIEMTNVGMVKGSGVSSLA